MNKFFDLLNLLCAAKNVQKGIQADGNCYLNIQLHLQINAFTNVVMVTLYVHLCIHTIYVHT